MNQVRKDNAIEMCSGRGRSFDDTFTFDIIKNAKFCSRKFVT